jgi:hypothetical protein
MPLAEINKPLPSVPLTLPAALARPTVDTDEAGPKGTKLKAVPFCDPAVPS